MRLKYGFICILLTCSITSMVSQDWAQLKYHQKNNQVLKMRNTNEPRVVFIGNSITEGWNQSDLSFFTTKGYINRGISSQTTAQMKIRFWQDVIELQPKVVVILAGINDIAQNLGYVPLAETARNIEEMGELAKAQGIQVVICSVLPANIFPWRMHIKPAEKVIRLNRLLEEIATEHEFQYLDFYSVMVDDQKGMIKEYTYDGVHCTLAGYKVMEKTASELLDRLLN